jgi:GAF domain
MAAGIDKYLQAGKSAKTGRWKNSHPPTQALRKSPFTDFVLAAQTLKRAKTLEQRAYPRAVVEAGGSGEAGYVPARVAVVSFVGYGECLSIALEFTRMKHDIHDSTPLGAADSPNAEFVEQSYTRVQEMLKAGVPRNEILTRLALAGEALAGPRASVSILFIDESGLLRNAASPNLPQDYLQAIDRLKPDAGVGTCAAAAATGCSVITPDFRADGKWAELRHLPLSLGFVGAWSMPIKSPEGKVLGTFGTYFRDHRSPSLEERRGVELLTKAVASVLISR